MFKAYYQMSHCKMPAREWRIRSPYQKTAEKIFLLTVSVYINISSQRVYLVNSFRLRVDFINPLAMFLHLPHLRTVFWALQVDLESGTAPDAMPRNTTGPSITVDSGASLARGNHPNLSDDPPGIYFILLKPPLELLSARFAAQHRALKCLCSLEV